MCVYVYVIVYVCKYVYATQNDCQYVMVYVCKYVYATQNDRQNGSLTVLGSVLKRHALRQAISNYFYYKESRNSQND